MEKKKYETPNFGFQEMKLMERVADKCWGYNYVFVDADANPATPPETFYWIGSSSGCEGEGGTASDDRLAALLAKYPELTGKVTSEDVKVNVKDSAYLDPPGVIS